MSSAADPTRRCGPYILEIRAGHRAKAIEWLAQHACQYVRPLRSGYVNCEALYVRPLAAAPSLDTLRTKLAPLAWFIDIDEDGYLEEASHDAGAPSATATNEQQSTRAFRRCETPCDDEECFGCAIAECPAGEPLHRHHDGCPACDRAPEPVTTTT